MRKVRRIQRRAHKSPRKVPLVRQRGAPQPRGSHATVLGKRKLFAHAETEEKVHKRGPVPQQQIVVPRDEKPAQDITPDAEADEQEQEPNAEELQAVAEETEQQPDVSTEAVKQEQLPRERTNAYSLYLREIGQTKLLTPAE